MNCSRRKTQGKNDPQTPQNPQIRNIQSSMRKIGGQLPHRRKGKKKNLHKETKYLEYAPQKETMRKKLPRRAQSDQKKAYREKANKNEYTTNETPIPENQKRTCQPRKTLKFAHLGKVRKRPYPKGPATTRKTTTPGK